jgi:hypothetical protein
MRPAMSQLDLRLLRYFVAVAETEHVGRAANRLGVSQSPLSRQLRQLESLLGVPLFVRESRRIRLSGAGPSDSPVAKQDGCRSGSYGTHSGAECSRWR